MASYTSEELLIATIADMLEPARHIAVGVLSPIPGSAALLARARSAPAVRPRPAGGSGSAGA